MTAALGPDGACPPAPEGALPVPPDSVDEASPLCAADWLQALVSCWRRLCPAGCRVRHACRWPSPSKPTPCPAPCPQADARALFPRFNCGNNTEAGRGLAQLVAQAAGDPRRQALLFRAFLMQFCAGGYYSPFAGDGLT